MKKNIKYSVSFLIIMFSLVFGFVVRAEENRNDKERPVNCTMDVKVCPDGSSVGRTGPNCEFVCPGEKDNSKGEEFRNRFEEKIGRAHV